MSTLTAATSLPHHRENTGVIRPESQVFLGHLGSRIKEVTASAPLNGILEGECSSHPRIALSTQVSLIYTSVCDLIMGLTTVRQYLLRCPHVDT